LIALIEEVNGNARQSKSNQDIIDVVLVGNAETKPDMLATIALSVFGSDKIREIKNPVGEPMAFFNLPVTCKWREDKPPISHYPGKLMKLAPGCEKTTHLRENQGDLYAATDLDQPTSVWHPNEASYVSGPRPLSRAGFLGFATGTPQAVLPDVVQLMWGHIEEPAVEDELLDASGGRIWYRVALRDVSGSALVGIPQRCAFTLAGCTTKGNATKKHAAG
jgi:hypothetical protein